MPRHRPALIVTLFWVLLGPLMAAEEANSVVDFRWAHRVLLLRTEAAAGGAIIELKNAQAAIDERDLLWFALQEDTLVTSNSPEPVNAALTASIKKHFGPNPDDRVILIGKDGSEKQRAAALDLEELFTLIDAMPMRRAEMRRQNNGS